MSSKSSLVWLAVPLTFWAVYQCWSIGYQRGYEAGHLDGWDTARRNFAPYLAAAVETRERSAEQISTGSWAPE